MSTRQDRREYFKSRRKAIKEQISAIKSQWDIDPSSHIGDWVQANGPMHLLSLGAGVQSSTMALMASRGLISPMPNAAIFADTQSEPSEVYQWLDKLIPMLPFPVHTVTAGNLMHDSIRSRVSKEGNAYISNAMPVYLKRKDGKCGMVVRSCTKDYKVKPILSKARVLAGVKERDHRIRVVSWIGISTDEAHRMKPSLEKWAVNRWPLIEAGLSRAQCLQWLKDNGYPQPPRSACVCCPYHSDAEWLRIKNQSPDEWNRAMAFERQLQDAHLNEAVSNRFDGIPFLHDSLVPLDEVKLNGESRKDKWGNECEGMCGI